MRKGREVATQSPCVSTIRRVQVRRASSRPATRPRRACLKHFLASRCRARCFSTAAPLRCFAVKPMWAYCFTSQMSYKRRFRTPCATWPVARRDNGRGPFFRCQCSARIAATCAGVTCGPTRSEASGDVVRHSSHFGVGVGGSEGRHISPGLRQRDQYPGAPSARRFVLDGSFTARAPVSCARAFRTPVPLQEWQLAQFPSKIALRVDLRRNLICEAQALPARSSGARRPW